MTNAAFRPALLLSLGLASLSACRIHIDDRSVGKPCLRDAECDRDLVCIAPVRDPREDPAVGNCQVPAGVDETCHRLAECADGLVCIIPAGGTVQTGGTCLLATGPTDAAASRGRD